MFREPTAEVAYNPEGQEIQVADTQKRNFFWELVSKLQNIDLKAELDTQWVILGSGNGNEESKFLKEDCDQRVLGKLEVGQTLTNILSRGLHTAPNFGRLEHLVAACLVDGEILYQSRGFDFNKYRAQNPQTKI